MIRSDPVNTLTDFFLPKCRPFYVVLEKGHGAGKKGMALEKRGMARCHAKTGYGKHYPFFLCASLPCVESRSIRSKPAQGKNMRSLHPS